MPDATSEVFLTPSALLDHWQGHRRLTRRVIEAFPEEQFTTFAIGGMRPFGAMAVEMLRMSAPTVHGVLTDDWSQGIGGDVLPRPDVLRLWDESTRQMDEEWAKIPAARFQERVKAFGMYEDVVHRVIMYMIDNENHHRGQGYVYLRALGITPPNFWERE